MGVIFRMKEIHYMKTYKVVLCPACDEIQVSTRRFTCKKCKKEMRIISSNKAKFPLHILNSYDIREEAEEICEHLKSVIRGEK